MDYSYRSLIKARLDSVKELLEKKGRNAVSFVKKLAIPACVTNEKGIFTEINEAYCHFYGYTQEELLGKHFTMVVAEEKRAYLTELHDLFMGQKYELQAEWSVVDKHGKEKHIFANAAYVVDTALNAHKITFLIDVTENKKEKELLEKTIGQLEENLQTRELAEAILIHDMRKPIGSIINIIDILQDPPFDEEMLELYRMIPELATKALHLIEAYNGIHRMEKGYYSPDLKPLDLVGLTHKLIKYLTPEARRKSIEFAVKTETDQIVLHADALYIEFMLENLLTNAIQASPLRERITVELRRESRNAVINVHNFGTIPDKIRARFFDKYVTHGKTKGTGLGTYIAKMIATNHQGNISFSTSEEQGTVVTVILPLEPTGI
jgi:PAS domain S-box-containing protein